MAGISHIIEHLTLPEEVKADVVAVYPLMAEAESHVHGKTVRRSTFTGRHRRRDRGHRRSLPLNAHDRSEKGYRIPRSMSEAEMSIVPTESFRFRHLRLYFTGTSDLQRSHQRRTLHPDRSGTVKTFVTEFKEMPVMRTSAIGYGMGKKTLNVPTVSVFSLGETEETGSEVAELSCNLDDMTPEALGFVQEILFAAGAL